MNPRPIKMISYKMMKRYQRKIFKIALKISVEITQKEMKTQQNLRLSNKTKIICRTASTRQKSWLVKEKRKSMSQDWIAVIPLRVID